MIQLAIVGTRLLACPMDRAVAEWKITGCLRWLRPDVVISGGANGVDSLAAEIAVQEGYSESASTLRVIRPRVKRWGGEGGYRWRDGLIAAESTHLLCLRCVQATTYGSGWTADRAEELGAVVWRRTL